MTLKTASKLEFPSISVHLCLRHFKLSCFVRRNVPYCLQSLVKERVEEGIENVLH